MLARNAAEKRPQGEDADGGREHPARAEAIRHPAADRNKHGEAQRVAGQHGLHAERSDGERLGDGGDGRVENRRVERFHEEGHGDEPRQQSLHDSPGAAGGAETTLDLAGLILVTDDIAGLREFVY